MEIAKSTDLVSIVQSLGYTVKSIGRYHTLKEMDSMRIYNRKTWFRWSGNYGGTQIDFLKIFCNMDIKEAVTWLLNFSGYIRSENRFLDKSREQAVLDMQKKVVIEEKKEFILPEPHINNQKLYDYLVNTRCISKQVVDYFVQLGLIYENKDYHNIVFKGNDKNGCTKFASMRGTYDSNGKSFKCDVAGNDKNYGFNVTYANSSELYIFEAGIDLLSFVDMCSDFHSNKLTLGMVSDRPLERYLEENTHIRKIGFCLDNDEVGRKATKELMEKYKGRGFEVDNLAPKKHKDYNEWLIDEIQNKNYSKKSR